MIFFFGDCMVSLFFTSIQNKFIDYNQVLQGAKTPNKGVDCDKVYG